MSRIIPTLKGIFYENDTFNWGPVVFFSWTLLLFALFLIMVIGGIHCWCTTAQSAQRRIDACKNRPRLYLTLAQIMDLPEDKKLKYLDLCQQEHEAALQLERATRWKLQEEAREKYDSSLEGVQSRASRDKQEAKETIEYHTRRLMKPLHMCSFFTKSARKYNSNNSNNSNNKDLLLPMELVQLV